MRKFMHSKTMWFSVALAVFGAIMDSSIYLQTLLEPRYFAMFMLLVAVAVAVLRIYTTKPLDEK